MGRREAKVEMPVWSFHPPLYDGGRFVSGVVVQDQMHLFARGDLGGHMSFDASDKSKELFGPVSWTAS